MKTRICKRGHVVEGHNAKTRPSTKYTACRQCELDSQAERTRRRREAEGLKLLKRRRLNVVKSLKDHQHAGPSTT